LAKSFYSSRRLAKRCIRVGRWRGENGRKFALTIVAAFALLGSISSAFAQVPPPVPALPDMERRTSYSITGSNCACSVGFALYGDSTDFNNWVEVYLNGVRVNFNDATFGWTITSPTGSLGFIPRPVTDGVLTFTNAQTGTVQIVGARRPRRVSQFTENRGVAARDLNQILTDIVAQNRETWDKTNDITGRGLFSQPGNTMGPLPLPSVCNGALLGFDSTGLNPLCFPQSGGAGGGGRVAFSGTITGNFNGGGTGGAFLASAAEPTFGWQATGQATDQKVWDAFVNGTTLQFRAVNDANSTASSWLSVTRGAGATVSGVSLPEPVTVPSAGLFYQPGENVERFPRFLVGDAALNNATQVASQPDWLTTWEIAHGASGGFIQTSQAAVLNSSNSNALEAFTAGAHTLNLVPGGNGIGTTSFGVNDAPSSSVTGFAYYGEGHRCATCVGGAVGIEVDPVNFNPTAVTINPFQQFIGQVIGVQVASGGQVYTGTNSASAAINIQNNNTDFLSGIIFGNNAIHGTDGTTGQGEAIAMVPGHVINYYPAAGQVSWQLFASPGINGNYNISSQGTGAVSVPALQTPSLLFGSGAIESIAAFSTNPGFGNELSVQNRGTSSTSGTFAAVQATLTGLTNGFVQMVSTGGATPSASISSGSGLTGGLAISAGAGALSLTSPTLSNANTTGTFKISGAGVGLLEFTASVNFNATGDTVIPITLPTGYTRYTASVVIVSGASAAITTSSAGLFTAASGGGVAIVATQTMGVSSSADATNNNTSQISPPNAGTQSYLVANEPNLFWHVTTPQGSAATATVTIQIRPLP
jgi:hypothetical protein